MKNSCGIHFNVKPKQLPKTFTTAMYWSDDELSLCQNEKFIGKPSSNFCAFLIYAIVSFFLFAFISHLFCLVIVIISIEKVNFQKREIQQLHESLVKFLEVLLKLPKCTFTLLTFLQSSLTPLFFEIIILMFPLWKISNGLSLLLTRELAIWT